MVALVEFLETSTQLEHLTGDTVQNATPSNREADRMCPATGSQLASIRVTIIQ